MYVCTYMIVGIMVIGLPPAIYLLPPSGAEASCFRWPVFYGRSWPIIIGEEERVILDELTIGAGQINSPMYRST